MSIIQGSDPKSHIRNPKSPMGDFYNDGFGWICRQCERELAAPAAETSRLLNEGESEGKNPRLSNAALAKWADPARRTLVCPRCGITELIEKS